MQRFFPFFWIGNWKHKSCVAIWWNNYLKSKSLHIGSRLSTIIKIFFPRTKSNNFLRHSQCTYETGYRWWEWTYKANQLGLEIRDDIHIVFLNFKIRFRLMWRETNNDFEANVVTPELNWMIMLSNADLREVQIFIWLRLEIGQAELDPGDSLSFSGKSLFQRNFRLTRCNILMRFKI